MAYLDVRDGPWGERIQGEEGPPKAQAPSVAEDEAQRYETEVEEGVHVVDREVYESLKTFMGGIRDRQRYTLAVWRCDPKRPNNRSYQKYVTSIPVTSEALEPIVKPIAGGGLFMWQLMLDGKYISAESLPPTLQSCPRRGWIEIDGPPLSDEEQKPEIAIQAALAKERTDSSAVMSEVLDRMDKREEKVMERMRSERTDSSDMAKSLVAGFQTLMTSMADSQRVAAERDAKSYELQNNFLMGLLSQKNAELESRLKDKADEFGRYFDLWKEFSGKGDGGADMTTTDRLLKALPDVLREVNAAAGQRPPITTTPAPKALPAPVPARAAPTPASPTPGAAAAPTAKDDSPPTIPGLPPEDTAYITELINELFRWYQRRSEENTQVEVASEVLGNLGTDKQFEFIMEMDERSAVGLLRQIIEGTTKHPAPDEFLVWCREVFIDAKARWEATTEEEAESIPAPSIPVLPVPDPIPEAPKAGDQGSDVGGGEEKPPEDGKRVDVEGDPGV